MAVLAPDTIRLIEDFTIGCVATVRRDGTPAVSPKATFLVVDESTLAFSNIRSEGTVGNLMRQPDVEVDFVDVFARRGCRVRGRARYVLANDTEAPLRDKFQNGWPELFDVMRGFVIIDVTHVQSLSSPLYDAGWESPVLTDQWFRRYAARLGYTVSR